MSDFAPDFVAADRVYWFKFTEFKIDEMKIKSLNSLIILPSIVSDIILPHVKQKQASFFSRDSDFAANRVSHGGDMRRGRRKLPRPLDAKKPIHIVFKSSMAKGEFSLLSAKHRLKIERIVNMQAAKFGLTIHHFENVGNHLHLVARFARRAGFQNFMRTVPALIARLVTQARKGHALKQRFWDRLAFTRIVKGRRDFQQLTRYMQKNAIEREFGPAARNLLEQNDEVSALARRRGCTPRDLYRRWLLEMTREVDPAKIRVI